MIRIGFTGTRHGMTDVQWAGVSGVIDSLPPGDATGHHGDCVGADAEFHSICKTLIGMRVESHPSTLRNLRAFCVADVTHDPLPPLVRNEVIVATSDVMIAAPFEMSEQQRGGTWSTIRMVRKAGKQLYVVYRDGTVVKEPVT